MAAFLDSYAKRHLRRRGRPIRAETLRTKEVHVRRVANTCAADDLRTLAVLLTAGESADRIVNELYGRLTPRSVASALYALQAFMEHAVEAGWAEASALTKDHWPKRFPKRPVTTYSDEELDALLSAARNGEELRWWVLLMTLAETGRRIGELLDLRWSSCRFNGQPAYFVLERTKTTDGQAVPLTTVLREEVFTAENVDRMRSEHCRARRDPDEFLFPWIYSGALRRLERLCRDAGVECRGFHEFRRTTISKRLRDGMPLQAIAALAGHASPRTTVDFYDGNSALNYWRYVDGSADDE